MKTKIELRYWCEKYNEYTEIAFPQLVVFTNVSIFKDAFKTHPSLEETDFFKSHLSVRGENFRFQISFKKFEGKVSAWYALDNHAMKTRMDKEIPLINREEEAE